MRVEYSNIKNRKKTDVDGFSHLCVIFAFYMIAVLFWIIHTVLLFYVYILGTVIYQMYFAEGFVDSINSFFNISVFVLIANNSWWLVSKRYFFAIYLDILSDRQYISIPYKLILTNSVFFQYYDL